MFLKSAVGVLVVAVAAVVALMSNMSPSSAHPAILLLVFLLFYTISLVFILLLIVFAMKLSIRLRGGEQLEPKAHRNAYMYASVLALAPVIGLAINTVGGITYREIALIVAFEGIALFYVWKRH